MLFMRLDIPVLFQNNLLQQLGGGGNVKLAKKIQGDHEELQFVSRIEIIGFIAFNDRPDFNSLEVRKLSEQFFPQKSCLDVIDSSSFSSKVARSKVETRVAQVVLTPSALWLALLYFTDLPS